MNIRQTSLSVAVALALFFISVISYNIYMFHDARSVSIRAQSSIKVSSIINKAIIELSLERSVMQVALNLDDPIAPKFRALIDDQRAKSDLGFREAVQLVSDDKNFRRSGAFLSYISDLRKEINDIRDSADQSLALPLNHRDDSKVYELPIKMKSVILEFSKAPIKIRPENSKLSTLITTLERIQYNAWAVREYGGRERTYLAIATATGRSFDDLEKKEMKEYHNEALEAMSELNFLSGYIGLEKVIIENIENVSSTYFGSYRSIRNKIIADSEAGNPYSISFGDFFKVSTDALDTAVNLSYLTGDKMVEYMEKERQDADNLFWIFTFVLVLVIIICGFQIYYSQFKVSGRMLSLASFMRDLIDGNTDIDLKKLQSSDEIGQMVEHVEVFRLNAIEVKRLEKEQANQQQKAEEEKQQAAWDMANTFEERIGMIVESVETASGEMQNMSHALSEAISKVSEQSSSVASASYEASTNVQTVASAAEEMSASIGQMSQNVMETAQEAKQCASSAQISKEKLGQLQVAVEDIDSVIQSISDVAEQTNLLALNATIESARAGEAGKGFAVVASEVKNLANETHKMTDEISGKVKYIKESAQVTIDSVNNIIGKITEVDVKTENIALSIEEKNSVASEISESASQAADGTGAVSKNIEHVQNIIHESAESTDKLKNAANDLMSQSSNLKGAVGNFLKEVRQS